MKATLEFDVPESCTGCMQWTRITKTEIGCLAIGKLRHIPSAELHTRRSPFCPLKIVEDDLNAIKQQCVICGAPLHAREKFELRDHCYDCHKK